MASLCIKKIFQNIGYENTIVAFSGEQAIEMFEEHGPDLVLMDIGLPGIDGIETAKRMNESARDFLIVFVTAYSDDTTLKRAQETKPIRYVTKPIDEGDIKHIMKNLRGK
jgi:CheY-like chemotaxis protein